MLLNVFCSPGQKRLGAQTSPHKMQLILSGLPSRPLYNISVTTKVNALNLICVLIISNGVETQAEGDRNVEGGGRSEGRLVVGGGGWGWGSDGRKINYWSL